MYSPVILVKPPDEKVASLIAGIALVMLIGRQCTVHLTPMRTDIEQYESQEEQSYQRCW